MLLVLSCLLAWAQDTTSGPRLELESRAGVRTPLSLDEPLGDPRERDGWIVRRLHGEEPPPASPAADGTQLELFLVSGERIRGRLVGGDGERLRVALVGDVELEIDLLMLEMLDQPGLIPRGRPVSMVAPDEGDRLYKWTGRDVDPIGGTVVAFTQEGVEFESAAIGTRLHPWSEVARLFVEVLAEESHEEEEGVPVVLDLADRSRLRGTLIQLDRTDCVAEIAGTEARFPWRVVDQVLVDDGRLTYLSDLPAEREEGRGTPFGDELGMVWDHRVDACVDGSALLCDGVEYRRGIGMHAPTRVTWSLDGSFETFRALVGIDDSAVLRTRDARGSVTFRVLLDGRVAWESGVQRGGDAVTEVPPIALGETSELTLEADMVGDFRGDRANWLRALLVR